MSSNKEVKTLYFVINIICLVPFMMAFFSFFGIIAVGIILGLAYLYIVIKSNESEEAYTVLVKILFIDTLACASLIFLYFINSTADTEYSLIGLIEHINPMVSVFLVAYVAAVMLRQRSPLLSYIVSLLSLTIAGYLICLALCTASANFIMPVFIMGGGVILNTYLIFSTLFILAAIIVNLGEVKNFNIIMFSISVVIFFVVLISCYDGILLKAYEFEQGFGKLSNEAWLWAKVVIIYIITGLACFAMLPRDITIDDDLKTSRDINVLLILANAVLLYKFALSWYSRFNYLIVVIYIATALVFLLAYYQDTAEDYEEALDGLSFAIMIVIETVIFVLALWMVKHNMWINALIVLIFTIIIIIDFYKSKLADKAWLYAFLFVFLQALAWIFQFKLSLDNAFFTMMIFIMAMVTFAILNLKNPNGFKVSRNLNMTVFVLFCLLNLVLISRHGTKISIQTKEGKVEVSVEAIGKNNEIDNAIMYWTDERGEVISEEVEFTQETDSDINGTSIHIISTDVFGVVSKKTVDFPYWRYVTY